MESSTQPVRKEPAEATTPRVIDDPTKRTPDETTDPYARAELERRVERIDRMIAKARALS
jgi:hypothetical protein